METALLKAKSEMDVAKGKAQELEALVLKKDLIISEQKTLHNQIMVCNLDTVKVFMGELMYRNQETPNLYQLILKLQEEYDAKKPESEEAYNNLLVQNLQLEQRILELNGQIARSPSGMRQRRGNQGATHHRVTSSGSLSSQSNRSLVVSPTSPGTKNGLFLLNFRTNDQTMFIRKSRVTI